MNAKDARDYIVAHGTLQATGALPLPGNKQERFDVYQLALPVPGIEATGFALPKSLTGERSLIAYVVSDDGLRTATRALHELIHMISIAMNQVPDPATGEPVPELTHPQVYAVSRILVLMMTNPENMGLFANLLPS